MFIKKREKREIIYNSKAKKKSEKSTNDSQRRLVREVVNICAFANLISYIHVWHEKVSTQCILYAISLWKLVASCRT